MLYVTLSLGGGENWLFLFIKAFGVLLIPLTVAYLFPRFRTDDLVRLMWKWPVLLGLIGLAFMSAR